MGILPQHEYTQQEIQLEKDASILFITDGVTEARNTYGEMFENERLDLVLQQPGKRPYGNHLVSELTAWCGTAEPADDITLVEIYR